MKLFYIFTTILFLTGCVSNSPKSGSFSYLSNTSNDTLQQSISAGVDINKQDESGKTALHHALQYAPNAVNELLEAGANVNAQDNKGITPIHVAVLYNEAMVVPLLLKGADSSLATTGVLYCNNKRGVRKPIREANALQLASFCNKHYAASEFERFAKDTSSWDYTKKANNQTAYENYLRLFPNGIFNNQARLFVTEMEQKALADLKAQKKCAMGSLDWVFIEGRCKDKLAHGKGVAVTLDGKRFEGQFSNGLFAQGQYFEDDELVYDGPYQNDLPHGTAICRFEGAFEECKQYQGQRIDALFKQRQYMRSELGSMKKELAQLRQAVYSGARGQGSSTGSSSKYGYIADLNSKDDVKRTVSQVRAAVDLYQVLSK
ncbi:MAG: ankyrin repeat domain-containing protein [Bermanella sp.]